MNPYELAAVAASIAIAIAKRTPDDNELLTISIIIDLISDNLDAIIADRVLLEKISQATNQNQNQGTDINLNLNPDLNRNRERIRVQSSGQNQAQDTDQGQCRQCQYFQCNHPNP